MMAKNDIHPLVAGASIVIIVAGLRAAAPIVSPFLLAVLLATSIAPVVLWQLRKGWTKEWAILLTVLGVALAGAISGFLVGVSITSLAQKLPAYEARLADVGDSLADLLAARGVELPEWKTLEASSPETLVQHAADFLRALASSFSEAILVLLLVLFIVVQGAENRLKYDQGLLSADSWWAHFYGSGADVRKYVSITAGTGLLAAVANLILLLILGVDAAALWAFLSFVLNFIPNLGLILAVTPPAVLALLEFGPGRAAIVVIGFILINAVTDNVLKPKFIGKELDVSLLEVFLSLMFWSWVFGAIGAILAVPLTIVVKKLLQATIVSGDAHAARTDPA